MHSVQADMAQAAPNVQETLCNIKFISFTAV